MPLKLLPLPPSDCILYFQICWQAFRPGIMGLMFPTGYTAAAQAHNVATVQRRVQRHPGRTHFLQVIDSDLPSDDPFCQVAGVSQWKIYARDRTDEEMAEEEAEGDRDAEEFGKTPDQSREGIGRFVSISGEYEKKYIGGKAHVYLQAIGTRPGCERKGVAGLALEWGTKKADELGLPLFLESSVKGVELYKRWGFEALETLPFDAREFGYHDPLTHVFMRRPARTIHSS